MIIDTHSHLSFSQFKDDIDEVIKRAKESGVEKMINVGCSVESSVRAVKMLGDYDCLYATLGVHPHDAYQVDEDLMEEWEEIIIKEKRVVAVGECGLDYVKSHVSPEMQEEVFIMHLKLARKVGLPVIIHNRKADNDCLEILDSYAEGLDVVFHCYGSDLDFAKKLWERGYYTSFTGIVTFSNAESVRDVVREMPLDKFMVETDCPYLAPQAYRGKRNEPAYVVEVVKKIAEVKRMSIEEVVSLSSKNAENFFKRITS